MIIVSQDKDFIVNFKNIHSIGVDKVNGEYHINFVVGSGDGTLGQYKTEERAKEVLQEIIEVFTTEEFFHINKSSLNNLDELAEPKYILRPVSKSKVYYMPEVK